MSLAWKWRWLSFALWAALVVMLPVDALAHGVADGDKGYIQEISGPHPIPFMYLGAKHMLTGYDHLLFLCGVVFFLYRLKDVAVYVTLFAAGHVLTLLAGVLLHVGVSAHLVDAIIGFSVAYKALDNMGAFRRWFGFQPNAKVATFAFGLFHGLGLATKILEYELAPRGLVVNLLSFNVGVELGQILALACILIALTYWRKSAGFLRHAYAANAVIMTLGFLLVGYQVAGYLVT